MIDDKFKLETITSEFEKSQKHIKEMWLGEGWYKTTPNSFNYFVSGFEAGLNYQYLTKEEIEAIEEGIKQLVESDCISTAVALIHISTLRNLIERIKNESRITE